MEVYLARIHSTSWSLGCRFAIIANTHGNHDALKAVVKDIRAQGIDLIVNLGDCLSGPLEPVKTADMLMNMDMPTVRGDHDRALLATDHAGMQPVDAFAAERLSAKHRSWLQSLPQTLTLWSRVFLCHASPKDDTTWWLDSVGPDGRISLAERAHIERLAQGINATLILTAHTQVPRCVELADGRLVVNPGSVGCPGFSEGEPVAHAAHKGHSRANYVIVDEDENSWDVTFRLVSYDSPAASRKASLNRRPDWARALERGWVS
jgi:predicted phosphodiesterase